MSQTPNNLNFCMFSFSKGDMILEFSFYWFTVRFRKIVSAKNALFLSKYASLRNRNVCLFLMHEKKLRRMPHGEWKCLFKSRTRSKPPKERLEPCLSTKTNVKCKFSVPLPHLNTRQKKTKCKPFIAFWVLALS